jgi:SNF2 family DNA or RNA helicase
MSPETLERLYFLRKWDIQRDDAGVVHNPIPFTWPTLLRKTIYDIDNDCDSGVPLDLRQYQIQMVHHLIRMDKFINGDAVGLGKTVDVVAAAAWLKQRKPDYKIVIVTTKSTTYQWRDEFLRFSYLRPYVMRDSYRGQTSSEARYAQMESFFHGDKKDVMIVKYDSIKGTKKKVKDGKEAENSDVKFFTKIFKENKDRLILVFDECHKFKGTGTAVRNLVFSISRCADKTWGLTATVMKNSLNEFYAVATALGICPFGFMPEFVEEFCIMRPQYIGAGRKKMVLVGYQNIAKFKAGIRPFFLGRSQRQVKEPLPRLSTTYHPLDLTDQQIDLLEDIKNGVFILPPALIKDASGDLHECERDVDNLMTQLSVQQLVANHPGMLDPANTKEFFTTKLSPKEEALLDMLDGDLAGEKVIVFTKYKMWIDRMERLTKDGNFTDRKFLRITGNENEKQRNDNKRLFQGSPDHNLIVVNAAGIEGINLQQAAHMVLLDVPWSWGDLIQLVGRMVRMASPHSA